MSPEARAALTACPASLTWSSSGSSIPHWGAIDATTDAVQPIRSASRSAPPGPNDADQYSDGQHSGSIAARCGGRATAASHCV